MLANRPSLTGACPILEVLGPLYPGAEREFLIDNLLVRIHVIIVVIRWIGLTPWEIASPFPGSRTSTFPGTVVTPGTRDSEETESQRLIIFRGQSSVKVNPFHGEEEARRSSTLNLTFTGRQL